jgi:hypothetical protein
MLYTLGRFHETSHEFRRDSICQSLQYNRLRLRVNIHLRCCINVLLLLLPLLKNLSETPKGLNEHNIWVK